MQLMLLASSTNDKMEREPSTLRQHSAFVPSRTKPERQRSLTREPHLVDRCWRHSPSSISCIQATPSALSSLDYFPTNSPPTTFEPVLNVPALVTFLFITVIFSALILRTNQVEQAVQDRNVKLQKLRDMKSKELAGEDGVQKEDVQRVLKQYEQAVRTEEALRNLIPGVVRIVPPSAGDEKEEEASLVAKQMLGKDFDIGVPKRERNQSGQLSGVAIGALVMVAVLLVGQFIFLGWMYTNDPTSPMSSSSII
jgi:nitrate reductase NapE component